MSCTARTPVGLIGSSWSPRRFGTLVGPPFAILLLALGALAAALLPATVTAPALAASPSRTHAGTAADPIPLRLGDRLRGEVTEPSPHLDMTRFWGNPGRCGWLEYMSAPYPFPGAVVYALEPGRDGPVAIEVRSLDFYAALRLSLVMPDGEVIPVGFSSSLSWSSYAGSSNGRDSELRPFLRAGRSYRVEVFPWGVLGFRPQTGEFEVIVREPGPDLWRTRLEEKSGLASAPLWRHRLAYLEKVAARAEERGDPYDQARTLALLGYEMVEAAALKGLDDEDSEPPGFGLEEALAVLERALEIGRKVDFQPGVFAALVRALRGLGRPDEADRVGEEIRAGRLGEILADEASARGDGDDRRLWAAMKTLHGMAIDGGRLEKAEAFEAELREVAERVEPLGDILVAHTLGLQAQGAEARGDKDEAEALRGRSRDLLVARWEALEASVRRAGDKGAELQVLLHRNVDSGFHFPRGVGDTTETQRSLFDRSLALAREILSSDDVWFPGMLYHAWGRIGFLGPFRLVKERWDEAEPVIDRLVEEIEKVYGPGDPRLIDALDARWVMEDQTASFSGAVPLLQRAFAWSRVENGPAHWYTKWFRLWLGEHSRRIGRLLEAKELLEPLYQHEQIFGTFRIETATWLGAVYLNLNDYEAARKLAEGYPRHYSIARILLGASLSGLGEHEEAIRVLREEIQHARQGEYGVGAMSLASYGLAHVLIASGDPEGAWQVLLELQEYDSEKVPDPEEPRLEGDWSYQARIWWMLGDDDRALASAGRALELWREENAGREVRSSPPTETMAIRAALLARAGSAEALPAALEAERLERELVRRTLPVLSERRALLMSAWSGNLWTGSQISPLGLALSILARSDGGGAAAVEGALDAVVRARGLVLDEVGARNRSLSRIESDPEIAALQNRYHDAASRAAYLLVRTAGPLTDDEDRRILAETLAEREQAEEAMAAASLEFRRRREMNAAGVREVREAVPPGSALVSYQVYEHMDLGRGGGSDGPVPPLLDPPLHMAAFVLKPGEAEPSFVPLGDAEAIDAAVAAWREALASDQAALRGFGAVVVPRPPEEEETEPGRVTKHATFREAGAALRKLVWDPVAAHLGDAERVFIVPDGALNLVSFAALPDGVNRWLVESGPVIHYLSAERDLVRAAGEAGHGEDKPSAVPPGRLGRGGTLLALGGADFDTGAVFAALRSGDDTTGRATATVASAPTTASEPASGPGPGVEAAAAPGAASSGGARPSGSGFAGEAASKIPVVSSFRGERSGCEAFGERSFDALSQTRAEVEEIARLWEGAGREGGVTRAGDSTNRTSSGSASDSRALAILGSDATERAFKERAPGASVVHLATHGFFLGGKCSSALDDMRGVEGAVTAENPLVLSGLALAGANNREHAGEDEDDGILTAQEIAAMDLSSVEWAVLSACDTGVGEIKAGEGVFGLRRAFQVAGADTLIMSLWSVEDEATRMWMKALYEGRLTDGMDTAEAVRRASLTVLEDRRARGLSDHPFYWAAFVAAGDWR